MLLQVRHGVDASNCLEATILRGTVAQARHMANQISSQTLSRRLKGTPITANALHPGFVSAEIGVRNGWTVGFVWNLIYLDRH
jgi:hypothetical protein